MRSEIVAWSDGPGLLGGKGQVYPAGTQELSRIAGGELDADLWGTGQSESVPTGEIAEVCARGGAGAVMQDVSVTSVRGDFAIESGVVDNILVPKVDEGVEESSASVKEGD